MVFVSSFIYLKSKTDEELSLTANIIYSFRKLKRVYGLFVV